MAMTYTKHSSKNNVPASNDPNALLTIPEVARMLRVDETTVRRWVRAGALEAVKLPSHGKWQALRVKRATIDALLSGKKGAEE
jgi:excisionase family DNA binding protein